MKDDATLRKIRRMLEAKMPRTILKAGTVRDCYLLAGGDPDFKPAPRILKRPRKTFIVTSAYLKRRFGINA